ncbi:MAG: histidine kinase dimerization/phospho-acceptor domain-containing protein [Dehalococcoidia bacterium]
MTVRDITASKVFEQARRDFLAMAAHELRNPLAALKGYAGLIRRRGRYDENAAIAIEEQAAHLERLVS